LIDLYYWPTPNGRKISIMLEECALPYKMIPLNIGKGEQFTPEFLAISPNNRMPAIVDRDGPGGEALSVFESGAILVYLAEKTGKFMPTVGPARYAVMQWLMFQMGGLGPMCGQAHHFRQKMGGEDIPYAVERYTNEVGRLYGVMDRRLGEVPYLGGPDYSIADMACWPWVRPMRRQGWEREEFPNVKRWFDMIAARPAVAKDMKKLEDIVEGFNQESWDVAFGSRQHSQN